MLLNPQIEKPKLLLTTKQNQTITTREPSRQRVNSNKELRQKPSIHKPRPKLNQLRSKRPERKHET
ncbi:hypothetical protein AALP_AA1G214100 [Arabis alpina]|uniref:Uncharacterized protein n=1 Tax=Arabis alpina TaxID=50452 RepID=A0A087HPN3_ARAAL|nr:hypothetical protein AALP_AA1G214100 [Arabis alpina]